MDTDSTTTPTTPEEDLRERAMELLEFPQVVERLAGHTQTPLGRELALSLRPAYSHQEVQLRQQETSEAVLLLERGREVEFSAARDVRKAVESAALGATLPGPDLRDVAGTARALGSARSVVGSQSDLGILSHLARQIADFRDLERRLTRAIGQEGEVLDGASSQLAEMRIRTRETFNTLESSLQRTMRALYARGVLQEPIITQRQGRMVILVKAEMRQHVRGIVHDVSDSGATLFVEPLPSIPQGNQWQELRLAALREEERVLRELSALVGEMKDDLALGMDVLARIDLAMAKARYSTAVRGVPASLVQDGKPYILLSDARHPLLSGHVVPNTIQLGDGPSIILVTGPNAGGKTVSLKMAGLLTAMAQAGLHVPAIEAVVSVFDGFYADIGDQQSIQRSLSTFSSHVQNLGRIFDHATPHSLVLIDELGTSTDPEEGAALAKAILRELHRREIPAIATSHHRDLAAFVQDSHGMTNASVELDPDTLTPTYKLNIGLPERSYALTIATKLGMPQAVIDDARSMLSPEYLQTEGLLSELQLERRQAIERSREAQEELREARELRQELEQRLAGLEQEREIMVAESRRELEARVEEVRQRLRAVERSLPAPRQPQPAPALREQRQEVAQVRRELQSPAWRGDAARDRWLGTLRRGDLVNVRGIGQALEVLSERAEEDGVDVALGSIRVRVSLDEIEGRVEAAARAPGAASAVSPPAAHAPAQRDLDLRGVRVADALERLDGFLDKAVLAGLSSVRLVHGVGTGALRSAVREHLARHVLVGSFASEEGNSSDGATVVELA
ncbi:MAG: Smr/MutS family protein [Chloroflexota bacterium]|nr:Smr/MutS family protein [Chloroflexota bacterium]MDE2941572.1 Smr/MutS family protein [Chloroflexota bacterium]MDE3268053.1 Smr/MutS family protein [Chloroflexota bacterium]